MKRPNTIGPRQSGKTTLARTLFSQYRYVNLESFEEQKFAQTDPKGFLQRFESDQGVILDEIQKVPKLLSSIQLEASYVIFLLQPYHVNYNKRVVKTPKLYFYDTSLACSLLRITSGDDLYSHYLRGGLFESMVMSNLLKNRYHHCLPPNAYFWRDKTGNEIDCILEEGSRITPVEIKSTSTLTSGLFDSLKKWSELAQSPLDEGVLIYGGSEAQKRANGRVLPWRLI